MSDSIVASKKELVMHRQGQEGDINFIYATWLQALYYGNGWSRNVEPVAGAPVDIYSSMDRDVFFKNYNNIIQKILIKPSVSVNIACLIEDPDVILGYSVTEPEVLHFVFVKDVWRRMGIARDLIPADTKTVTHLTRIGRGLKPKEWGFNPFLI